MNLQEIKRIPMNDVLSRYGLKPNRAGFIRCPFHNDKTASLKIYRDHWCCFGCGAGGDQFDFVQRMENISFSDAFKSLGGSSDANSNEVREAIARKKHEDLATDVEDALKALLATALTMVRKTISENKPRDPDSDYSPAWITAANALPWLEYCWEIVAIDNNFDWREEHLRELTSKCKELIASCGERQEASGV